MTIEVWCKPADLVQTGPARIVTFSSDTGQRNFTLGQKGVAYEVRFRTTKTSPNGEPAVSTPGGGAAAEHVAAACSPTGDVAVVYLPVGGTIEVNTTKLQPGWRSRWFNPRSGEDQVARPEGAGRFRSPGPGDWVLVFTSAAGEVSR